MNIPKIWGLNDWNNKWPSDVLGKAVHVAPLSGEIRSLILNMHVEFWMTFQYLSGDIEQEVRYKSEVWGKGLGLRHKFGRHWHTE